MPKLVCSVKYVTAYVTAYLYSSFKFHCYDFSCHNGGLNLKTSLGGLFHY